MTIRDSAYIVISLMAAFCNASTQSDKNALAYCYAHPTSYIILLWPVAETIQPIEQVERHLLQRFQIIYKKEFSLNNDGPLMFVRQIYARQRKRTGSWEDDFKGLRNKAQMSFIAGSKVRAYLVDPAELSDLKKFKKEMRRLFHYNIIHVNDTHEETVSIAQIVFSDPTIEFFNACTFVHCKNFETLLVRYREFLTQNRIDPTSCCIVGDAVQAAYGLKECERLDFIESHTLRLNDPKADLTEENTSCVYDHESHFYFLDLKFARLPVKKGNLADHRLLHK